MRGKVKWFDPKKKFGFIQTEAGSEVYVHQSAIADKERRKLIEGQEVTFEITEGRRGPEAANVELEKQD